MKALTVKQPWAWAIATGEKTVENRSRNTQHRGLVAIHAGLAWSARGGSDARIVELARTHGQPLAGDTYERGAIIAIANIVDAHPESGCCAPWGDREYDGKPVWHWVLEDAKPLDRPFPCRGALGLWTVSEFPDDLAGALS